jgi:hypothetical protein
MVDLRRLHAAGIYVSASQWVRGEGLGLPSLVGIGSSRRHFGYRGLEGTFDRRRLGDRTGKISMGVVWVEVVGLLGMTADGLRQPIRIGLGGA